MRTTEATRAEADGSPTDYETLVGERSHKLAREAADTARGIVISHLDEIPEEHHLLFHEHGRRVWTEAYGEIIAKRQSGEMNDPYSEVPGCQAVVATDNPSMLRNFLRLNPGYTRQVESIYAQFPLMAVVELPRGSWRQSIDGAIIYTTSILDVNGKVMTGVNAVDTEGLTVLRAYGGGGESYIRPLDETPSND